MNRPKLHLAYNGYTQTFALFEKAEDAEAFRAHQANACLMTAVVEVEVFASGADAIAHCKPSEMTPTMSLSRPERPSASAAHERVTANPMRNVMKSLNFADVVNALQEDDEE